MLSFIKSALKPSSSEGITLATEAIEKLQLSADPDEDLIEWQETVFDIIRSIRDPEKEETLEELNVVRESLISVTRISSFYSIRVEFVPTVPHCSLATLIGLCLITKLNQELPPGRFKIDLAILEGSHTTADEITKQINDKERVAAALENPNLRKTVDECIRNKD